jgi:hypothetical protein
MMRGARIAARIGLAVALAAGVSIGGAPGTSFALTLAPLPLEQLLDAAPIVVRARCLERQSASGADGRIDSLARFAVLERVKGASGAEIVVRQLGGRDGDREVVVPGAPLSEPGDEALLFLAEGASGGLEIVGIAHGYLPIVAVPGGETLVRVSSRLGPEFSGGGVRPLATVLARVRALAGTVR